MRGFREIDRILRGEVTSTANLRQQGLLFPLGQVFLANLLLAAFAGICMGVYGIAGRADPEFRFLIADAIKVPLLFLVTLAITFPSLYVFNALVGSPLGVIQLGRLLAAAMAVLLAVLASFGPILAFFASTSSNYPFILLLNVAIFMASGWFGVHYLWRTMGKLTTLSVPTVTIPPVPIPETQTVDTATPTEPEVVHVAEAVPNRGVLGVFAIWIVAFALVGMQVSWVLRPFIGHPDSTFSWFRPRQDSFIEAVSRAIQKLSRGN